jgi:predicted dehydrogenase
MSLGFGIVGCGMIARFHARAIQDLPGARLVGCCSRTREAAEKFAVETGCKAYYGLDEMLADPAIQVVTICTPSGDHLEPAVAAMRAGRHVLVEKPLEITTARCDQMIAVSQEQGVVLGTIFPSRFQGCWQVLRRAIENGRFGTLTLGDAFVKWFRTQQYYDSGAWRGTWALDGGGALMNQAIHTVDLLLWLLGDVAAVSAFTTTRGHERIEVEDVAVASLRFKNGALGVIEATTSSYPGQLKRIEIHGTKGSAIVEENEIRHWEFASPDAGDEQVRRDFSTVAQNSGGATDPKAIGHQGHLAQFQDFVAAVQAGKFPAIDGREGRRSVELITAIYRAAQSGQVVEL